MTLFERLKASCPDAWSAYVDHPFVRGMGAGDLAEAAFRHYLVQDYLFLIHFARAYALAIYKTEDLDEMRDALGGVQAILGEMELHVAYCADWGIAREEIAVAPEASACMAYTRFVLEKGLSGDLLDLHVALSPCVIGYGEIGARLAADPATLRDANPYLRWIDEYASQDYAEVAASAIARLDRLSEKRGGEARFADLARTFERATRLEADFWAMGLERAT